MDRIYLQRVNGKRGDSPAVPVSISSVTHGMNYGIRLQTEDGLDVLLKSSDLGFLAVLKPMIEEMERGLSPERRSF